MNESDYSLKESFKKIGALPIPKFKDEKGNIIDGLHREIIGAKVPTVKLPIKNPLQFHIVRLVINKCRRNMPAEEISQALAHIAELSGWTPQEMAEKLPFSKSWIYQYLPNKFKKAHYFINGRSLCGKWMFFGALEDSNHDSPDNCKTCRRKLQKFLNKKKEILGIHSS